LEEPLSLVKNKTKQNLSPWPKQCMHMWINEYKKTQKLSPPLKELPGRVCGSTQPSNGKRCQASGSTGSIVAEGLQARCTWLSLLLGFHSIPGPGSIICQVPEEIWRRDIKAQMATSLITVQLNQWGRPQNRLRLD
jgi:hypothetical protein